MSAIVSQYKPIVISYLSIWKFSMILLFKYVNLASIMMHLGVISCATCETNIFENSEIGITAASWSLFQSGLR